jgi:histidinol-phosphate/aromatic aminotransferase/cobyric acid decarboxylase-like protein
MFYSIEKPESTKADVSSSSDWTLDKNELESMINSRTRLIIVNSPNNPIGKVDISFVVHKQISCNLKTGFYT